MSEKGGRRAAPPSADDLVGGGEPTGRKGQILRAALAVFSAKGYSAGSMREIASRVGVSEPALYRHFSGKGDLFVALMRAVGSHVRGEVTAIVDGLRPEGLRGQLVGVLAGRRRMVRAYEPALRMIVTAAAHERRFGEAYRDAMVGPVRERLSAKAAELDAAYGVRRSSAEREERVRALMALMVGYMVTSVVLADEPDAAVTDAVLRVMGWEGFA